MRVFLALILVNLLFGAGFPFAKELLHHVAPGPWIFARFVVSTLVLFLFRPSLFLKPGFSISTWFWVAVGSVMGIILNNIFFIEGVFRTLPSHAALINATVPLQATIFGWMLIRERVGKWKIFGIVLGLVGVVYLFKVEEVAFLRGDLLSLGNAASYALYLVVARYALKNQDPLKVYAWMGLLGMIGIGFYANWNFPASALIHAPLRAQIICLYLIFIPTIFCFSLNLWALKRLEASTAALFVYLQPVIATFLSYFMLNDVPSERFYVSAVLILAGLFIGNWKRK